MPPQQQTPEQHLNPAYAADSPDWEVFLFVFKDEEQRRRGVQHVRAGTPPPLVVRNEDLEEEASYQAALAAVLRESEEEERRKEEAAYQARMAEAMALSAAGDCVVPLVARLSPVKAEPEPTPIERYSWTGEVREWVSAPPVWMRVTEAHERAYLKQWRQRRLAEERREGEYLEQLERDAEEEQREAEEEARQAHAAVAHSVAANIAVVWNTAFPWAGPAPTLIDLTGPDAADEDA